MAKQNINNADLPNQNMDDGDIPVVTIPSSFGKNYGNIFLIAAILIAEAIGAYTVVALYYPNMYEYVYGQPPEMGGFYELEDLTVNPAGSNGTRFLVVSIGIQVRDKEDIEVLQRREIMIRDAINTLLSRRTVEELAQLETRKELKQEIGIMINQRIERQAVKDLFFTEYVMQ